MIEITPIFVTAIIFGFVYNIIFILVRKSERMAMLEKGVDASFFITKPQTSQQALKFGLLFIGVAIGILLGSILSATTVLPEEAAYFSMIFLFGGLGLVINYFIEKKDLKGQGK